MAALALTISSCADNAANLFGAETNGLPVSSAIFLATDGSSCVAQLLRPGS